MTQERTQRPDGYYWFRMSYINSACGVQFWQDWQPVLLITDETKYHRRWICGIGWKFQYRDSQDFEWGEQLVHR